MSDKKKAGSLRIRTWDAAVKELETEINGDDDDEINRVAKSYYDCNFSTIAAGNLGQAQTEEEIQTSAAELTRTISLSSESTYDTVFWLFFYEDNPYVMAKIKMTTTLTIAVHLFFIVFYVKALGDWGELPYYGDFSLNLVRLITAMLLHMQMYVEIEKARQMLTFLIHNPDRFACDLLIWPAMVTITKVFTAFGA